MPIATMHSASCAVHGENTCMQKEPYVYIYIYIYSHIYVCMVMYMLRGVYPHLYAECLCFAWRCFYYICVVYVDV